MINLRRKPRKRTPRKGSGIYMLELLIAIATSSALSAVIVSNMAETQRFSTAGQENVMAFAVAQEIVDMVRNLPFGSLGAESENYTLAVNRLTAADPPSAAPFNHAMLIDNTNPNVIWSEAAQNNLFDAEADLTVTTLELDADGLPLTKRVKVSIRWPKGLPPEKQRKYELYTIVSANGIHN